MSQNLLSLLVQPRGKFVGSISREISLSTDDSASELYKRLSRQSGLSENRLRVTLQNTGNVIPNSSDVTLGQLNVLNGSVLSVKDLGPQVAWRTVFIVEYLGPIIIHIAVYLLNFNPKSPLALPYAASNLQKLSLGLIVGHFVKREIESIYVHRFSSSTMPLRNIFKNSAHYWILSGALIAWFTYSSSSPISIINLAYTNRYHVANFSAKVGTLIYIVGETCNFISHLKLRNLRKPGSKERGIPKGFPLFDIITCPNYFFEILSWLGIGLVNLSWSTFLFTFVAAVQMGIWAKKKETLNINTFGKRYTPKSWFMVPGIF